MERMTWPEVSVGVTRREKVRRAGGMEACGWRGGPGGEPEEDMVASLLEEVLE